ncbi:MAG: hypothetical protein WKF55_08170 [Gemmatimonadaceae bacterium]
MRVRSTLTAALAVAKYPTLAVFVGSPQSRSAVHLIVMPQHPSLFLGGDVVPTRSKPFALLSSRLTDARLYLNGVDACISAAMRELRRAPDQKASISAVLAQKGISIRVSDRAGFANRLRRNSAEYVLHSAYAFLAEYLQELLGELYDRNPLAVVSKAPGKFDYHEVVTLGSFEAIRDVMVEKVFRRLEATKSTQQLLERILDHTGVLLPETLTRRALMYIEARHLIVHNAGKIDERFLERFGDLITTPTCVGGRLNITKGFGRYALTSLEELAGHIDGELISRGFVGEGYITAGDSRTSSDASPAA